MARSKEAQRDRAGLAPVQASLELIGAIRDLKDLPGALGKLHGYGVDAFFQFGSNQDSKDQTKVIGQTFQGGLGLPNGEYYTKQDPDSVTMQEQYRSHIERTFELAGMSPAQAQAATQAAYRVELELARVSLNPSQLRDPVALYNPTTVEAFTHGQPHFDLAAYFQGLSVGSIRGFNDATPKFSAGFDHVLATMPLEDLKVYLKWRLLSAASSDLSKPFVDEDFAFQSRLTGAKTRQDDWQIMVRASDELFGDALGKKYVEKHFSPEAKAKAEDLVKNVLEALGERIEHASWMSPATREQALDKLHRMRHKIGYPAKWKDYSSVVVDSKDHLGNVFRARLALFREDLDRIGKPVDQNRWLMTASTVNAYYDPSNNEFVFPAAILQPPYFDEAADDAINYGATGATIGHEITHGFDDEGRQFDSHGNLRDWWTAEDVKRFDERAKGVELQFDAFQVDGLHVRGKQVLGESLADLGGIEIAWRAFLKARQRAGPAGPSPDGFTPEQRFFLSYAQSWGMVYRPEAARVQILNNPHPLPEFRVNGPLADFPPFAQAFKLAPGTPMVRTGPLRCHLWDD